MAYLTGGVDEEPRGLPRLAGEGPHHPLTSLRTASFLVEDRLIRSLAKSWVSMLGDEDGYAGEAGPNTPKVGDIMPTKDELPSTLQRSPKKAQETWSETHDSAVQEYGEGERAHRTAFASLKHSFEKVGDHWEAKDEKGPSDKQAERSTPRSRKGGETAGGVDANASKSHLYDVAKKLDIEGRSKMGKDELVDAIEHANDRLTRKSRS